MSTEVVVITTYKRPELLHCCLKRIRAIEPVIPISIFPDRGTADDQAIQHVLRPFIGGNLQVNLVPDHDYHGNSFNTLESLRWAYNEGYDHVYYIEDDVMVHPDFFAWHRAQHCDDERRKLFASMAWVFNRHAPITDDLFYQPWYYAIGTCFARKKLSLVAKHATPRYYEDMQGYIEREFPKSNLNSPFGIQHFEQDGLIQRILDRDKSQTVSPGIAKCDHAGFFGYNRGWTTKLDLFTGCEHLSERIQRLEDFIADPYERAEVFGRDIVQRELGYILPKREIHYRATVPGGWESEFVSEKIITAKNMPTHINSVRVTPDMAIEKIT